MAPNKDKRVSINTEFKKGIVPKNKLSVGTITIRTHKGDFQRQWIKISEPNCWIPYAEFVWIENSGTIPTGYIIHHNDDNTMNDSISNLCLLSRKDHLKHHYPKLLLARKDKKRSDN